MATTLVKVVYDKGKVTGLLVENEEVAVEAKSTTGDLTLNLNGTTVSMKIKPAVEANPRESRRPEPR